MKRLYEQLILVQYIFSDQRVLFQYTLRVHSECKLSLSVGCTSCGATNEELLSKKLFTRNQIKICVAMHLNIFVYFIRKFEYDVIWLRG